MHPTHRLSRGRTRRRRNHHAISAANASTCPNCGEAKLPHVACGNCGYVRPGLLIKIAGKNEEE